MNDKIKLITPLSLGLPKTGQETVYAIGDDATYQAGWWLNTVIATNRTRFIEKEIVSGEIVILDLATGLMRPKDGSAAGCNDGNVTNWFDAISFCNALNFSGFNNWRLPNVLELITMCNFSVRNPSVWDTFTNIQTAEASRYWTSSTYKTLTTQAWYISFLDAYASAQNKTQGQHLWPVRTIS